MTRHRELMAVLLLLLLGCSKSKESSIPCVDGDTRCGSQCDAMLACPTGLYCASGGVCAKQCVSGSVACKDAGTCRPDGMCEGGTSAGGSSGRAAAGAAAAGAGGVVAAGAGVGMAVGGAGGRGAGASMCADTVVKATRVTPTVILVVDQSGSMTEDFGTGSRWSVLRDSLLADPTGLITALQAQVQFGLTMYSARADDGPVVGECPIVTSVMPALNNRAAIAQVYGQADPIDETPTGDAIDRVVMQLNLPANFDPMATPISLILATDGEPDRCEDPNPESMADNDAAKAEVVAAVTRAFQRGIRTYVISVGDDLSMNHQRDVANAGVGHQAGQLDAQFWRAGDDQSLRAALTQIVGSKLSCDISLNGSVQGDPCRGTVMFKGMPLICKDRDGWDLIDATHIRLQGAACDRLNNEPDVILEVRFPCDVVVL